HAGDRPSVPTRRSSDLEFFIPQAKRESSLYGTEFEIRLRNRLTQRAIARECADWIKEKVEFRSNRTGAPMQQFAVVDERAAFLRSEEHTSELQSRENLV